MKAIQVTHLLSGKLQAKAEGVPAIFRSVEQGSGYTSEKEALKLRNRVHLTRIASTLQQVSNRQILQSLGEFLNVYT